MYPGSLAREILKKDNRHDDPDKQEARQTVIRLRINNRLIPDLWVWPIERHRFHAFLPASISAGTANKVHGMAASRKTGM